MNNILNLAPILWCPITQSKLTILDEKKLSLINQKIEKKILQYVNGRTVSKKIFCGFINKEGNFVYPIDNDIAFLLPQTAIRLDDKIKRTCIVNFDNNKKIVKDFYDHYGWKKTPEENFEDADQFEDLRPVSADYIHRCHMRVNKYLQKKGKYLLDVASGPIQYDEYLTYSNNFDTRICVDFALPALIQAKKRLGDKGVYILADITNLPFQNQTIDCVISLHTIYHVPAEEQKNAFLEIYRVLNNNSNALVVYSWKDAPLMYYLTLPLSILNYFISGAKYGIKKILTLNKLKKQKEISVPDLYFSPNTYNWFVSQKWPFNYKIVPWRSINVPFMKFFIHQYLLGRQILKKIYSWEKQQPELLGRIGQYPIIIIYK